MTGLTYPYTKYDRILGDNLADDLELNPKNTPPSGTAGGAGRYKYWADTTNPLGASLRQAVALRATAGVYIPTEWLTWGTIDIAARKFHFNTDGVDFTEGTGPLVVHDLSVTGGTTLHNTTITGTLSVSGVTTLGTLNAGATTLASLSVSGASALHDTTVTGNLSATGNIGAGGSITATGNLFGAGLVISGDASVGRDLHVVRNTQLDGTLNVSGGISTSSLSGLSSLSVSGLITSGALNTGTLNAGAITGSSLHITGNSQLDGTLNVNGASTFSSATIGTLHVTGNTDLDGTLNVDGATTLSSLHVTGNTNIDGTLTVGGSIIGSITVSGDLNVNSLKAATWVEAENYRLTESGTMYRFVDMGTDVGAIATLILGPDFPTTNMTRIALYSTGQVYNKSNEHNFWTLEASPVTMAVFTAGGTANVTGSWNIICDDTVKENIVPYSAGLAELLQLNVVSYNYIVPAGALKWSPFGKLREGETTPPTRYGMLASNVQAVIPEMVIEMTFSDIPEGIPDTSLATIVPTHLVWVLTNAVKEIWASVSEGATAIANLNDGVAAHTTQIADNTTNIGTLFTQVQALDARVAALEAATQ